MKNVIAVLIVLALVAFLWPVIKHLLQCPDVDTFDGYRCERRRWHEMPHISNSPRFHTWE
jgi:hypothetical protein